MKSIIILTAGLWVAGPLIAGPDIDPFARPTAPTVRIDTPPGQLDGMTLTGVSSLGPQIMVCVLTPSAQRGRWYTLGVAENGIVAAEYDAKRDAVRFEAGRESRWIAMSKSSIIATTLPRREDGSIDWAHMRKSDAEKAREAEAMMTDILEVGQMARMGRLKGSP